MHLHHINIVTLDLASSIAFYRDALGLTLGDRPDFDFPGAWLYDNDKPAVHLNEAVEQPSTQANAFNHVAFYTDDFDAALKRLGEVGVRYYGLRPLPDGKLRQCFMKDPNGITVEITGL